MLTQIRSSDVRETSQGNGSIDQERDQLKLQAQGFYDAAKVKAEAGEVSEAGLSSQATQPTGLCHGNKNRNPAVAKRINLGYPSPSARRSTSP